MGHTRIDPQQTPAKATEPAVDFYIPAMASLHERRPRTLKHDDTFAVFDHHGNIVAGEGSTEGLFHHDTRFLSALHLLINGRRPLLLSSTVADDNTRLTVDLTNPDFYSGRRLVLPKDTLHILRTKFLWQAACYERLAITNFDGVAHAITLGLAIDADFADIFEVRGHKRQLRGERTVTVGPDQVEFAYTGFDSVTRRTAVRFAPAPDRLDAGGAAFELTVPPRGRMSVFISASCNAVPDQEVQSRRFFVGLRSVRRDARVAAQDAATVETSNEIFNEVLCRSMSDFYMRVTNTESGPYPYAGIPWFSTTFGRDGIISALQMLWVDPGVARGVLGFLAARQARERDPAADAEPGKILHEARKGELARLGVVPFRLYYGGVDTTPLFVLLAGKYWERTGDIETIRALWPQIEAALAWVDTYGDADGDGFVEYQRQSDIGLANQGWKDSEDSVFHADGRLATGSIALVEVQAYVYAAKRLAAAMARELGKAAQSATLMHEAGALRERFEAAFWCDRLATYALALDGENRPCEVRTSNAGQVLFTGIAGADRAVRVADGLFQQAFFSGWGIRTVAAGEARYNPMSYHNGSIWPHDNALIALGLARYGLTDHVERLFEGLFATASYMDLRRLPELFCGFRRRAAKGPTFYPVACAPQAWAAATPFALLQACLGLSFDHRTETVQFRHPRLPAFLDEVVIRGITIGETRLDVAVRRYGSDVAVSTLRKVGDGGVSVTL